MVGTSVLKLKVDDKEYNASLKQAQQGMLHLEQALKGADKTFGQVDKSVVEYTRAIGQMEAQSKTTRSKINEMTNAFTELSMQYKRLTDDEKKGDFGKALTASLDQLKVRINDTKAQLSDVASSLGDVGSGGVNLQSVLDQLGGKLGVNTSLLHVLSAGTVGATAAIGAMVTTTLAAAKAFADYNSELSMQGQVTTVTTGLKGPEADRMTDAARSIADVYNVDFREVINAANTLMTQFGQSGSQAIQLIRDGMQGMIMGDGPKLLSMIQQYAPSFRDAGISASQLVAIIHNSEGGIFTDQNMNAIVMGIKNIRLMTNQTSEALGKMGIDGAEMTRKLNDGSMTVFEALGQVSDAIERTGSGSQAAGEVMQYVFGRQGTMTGTKLGEAIATLNTNLEETKNQTGELGQSYADLEQANERLNTAIRECFGYDGWQTMATGIKTELVGALSSVLELVGEIKNSVVGELAGTIFDTIASGIKRNIGLAHSLLILLNNITGRGSAGTAGNAASYGAGLGKAMSAAQPSPSSQDKPEPLKPEPQKRKTPRKTGTSPRQRAEDSVDAALQKYTDAINLATREKEAGTLSEIDYTKQMLSGQRRLYEAYGQAYKIYADPSYKEAQDQAAAEIVRLGGEVKGMADAQEAARVAARELETAQKQLADAEKRLAEAQASGSPTAVYKAQKDVDRQQDVVNRLQNPSLSVPAKPTGFDAMVQTVQAEIKFDQMKVDEASLHNLLSVAIKNGLDSLTVDYAGLQEKIAAGIDIPDSTWEELATEINDKLKAMGIEPIKIDVKTGNVKEIINDGKNITSSWQVASGAISKVGSALESIEDPTAKVAGLIAQAVASVISAAGQAIAAKDTTSSGWAWIGAAAAITAEMIAIVGTIHSMANKGYATGGIVDGRGGGFITGNSYSGDNIGNVNLDAGELVLTRSQQGVLAAQLSSGQNNGAAYARVSGEQLYLVIQRALRRKGRGEILTFK